MLGIRWSSALLAVALLGNGSLAWANVQVSRAWARATLPGQKVGAIYMQLRSDEPARLVAVKCPVAQIAEMHEMSNDGGVMRMRQVDSVDLPAGQTVVFQPGGYHVMLFEIERPLKPGERVPFTLVIQQGGKRFELPVEALVRSPLEEDPPAQHQ